MIAASKPRRDTFLGEMKRPTGVQRQRMKGCRGEHERRRHGMETSLANHSFWLAREITLADICVFPALIRREDLGYERPSERTSLES